MWIPLAIAGAALALKVVSDLYNDTVIRDEEYTIPLASMPQNAEALIKEMLSEAAKDKNLTEQQLVDIESEIYRMMSEGAVSQRNFEMDKTRGKISGIGLFLSWFMKQQGLSLAAIEAKYAKEFSASEKQGHMAIIQSAARSNQSLINKFYCSLLKRAGLSTDRNAVVAAPTS